MSAATTTKTDSNGDHPTQEHILTAEAILAAKDLVEEVIDVPEWGGSVKVRSFSKKSQQEIRDLSMVEEELDNERLEMFMFIRGVIEPKFTDDQYELLRDKSAGVLDRILTRIMELSGMTSEQQVKMERKFPPRT